MIKWPSLTVEGKVCSAHISQIERSWWSFCAQMETICRPPTGRRHPNRIIRIGLVSSGVLRKQLVVLPRNRRLDHEQKTKRCSNLHVVLPPFPTAAMCKFCSPGTAAARMICAANIGNDRPSPVKRTYGNDCRAGASTFSQRTIDAARENI